MKYGVLGGSFDPPHIGHLELAKAVKAALDLDEIVVVPANRNPLKRTVYARPSQRMEMCKLMTAGEDGMTVSDIEITRGGPSYSVDTIEELKMTRPGDYWLILGADALRTIEDWKEPDRLVGMCRFAVVERGTEPLDYLVEHLAPDYRYAVDRVPMTQVSVSSSKIREDIARGLSAQRWLKPAVWEYIENIGLYRE